MDFKKMLMKSLGSERLSSSPDVLVRGLGPKVVATSARYLYDHISLLLAIGRCSWYSFIESATPLCTRRHYVSISGV